MGEIVSTWDTWDNPRKPREPTGKPLGSSHGPAIGSYYDYLYSLVKLSQKSSSANHTVRIAMNKFYRIGMINTCFLLPKEISVELKRKLTEENMTMQQLFNMFVYTYLGYDIESF